MKAAKKAKEESERGLQEAKEANAKLQTDFEGKSDMITIGFVRYQERI